MSKEVIYIAGAITNDQNYESHFDRAEQYLKEQGYIPINPIEPWGLEYKEYIDISLAKLKYCDGIYMLKGWNESKGAVLEHLYAQTIGLKIMYEE